MTITKELLKGIVPVISERKVVAFLPFLNNYCNLYGINTKLRVAAFLAQILHESGCFLYTKEIASGAAYEGRKDLGNTQSGDGPRFKGRGLIQITGRVNYTAINGDWIPGALDKPELLELPEWAVKSAVWFWTQHRLNDLADKGMFIAITKRINGGTNGLAQRQEFYDAALKILGDGV